MGKTPVDRNGNPINPPHVPRWTRHSAPPPDTEVGYIVRMALRSGYWSYRPTRACDVDCLGYKETGWRELALPQRKILVKEDVWREVDDVGYRAQIADVETSKKKAKMWGRLQRTTYSRVKDDGPTIVGLTKEGKWIYQDPATALKEMVPRAVSPSGRDALLKLTDDPVENGKELAKAEEKLPSDEWRRGQSGIDRGVKVISREDKEEEDLRRAIAASLEEEKNREGEVEGTPVYSVRVIPLRRNGKGKDVEVGDDMPDQVNGVESALVIEDGAEETWDEIFQDLEAQGWVPVDGWAEGKEEDDLASIAESWIMTHDVVQILR